MRDQFQRYLIEIRYSVTTPSGNPSTVYAYLKAIDSVCEWERLTWDGLAGNIGSIVCQYDVGGKKADLGSKSHRTVINALRRFQDFSLTQK